MYRSATIAAYDVIDAVHVHAVVRLWDGFGEEGVTTESSYTATLQGVGSGSDTVWLRDALVALLETL